MDFTTRPIGWVSSPRSDPIDDDWGEIVARVALDSELFSTDALRGLDEFSHVDVVYVFDHVPQENYEARARRPRGNPAWPEVGVFAQRNKRRPNRIGVSTCRLLRVDGREPVRQPPWSHELMKGYW